MAYVVHVVQRWLTNYNPFYLENKNRGNDDSDWRPKWSLEELVYFFYIFEFSRINNHRYWISEQSVLTLLPVHPHVTLFENKVVGVPPFYILVSSTLHTVNIQQIIMK